MSKAPWPDNSHVYFDRELGLSFTFVRITVAPLAGGRQRLVSVMLDTETIPADEWERRFASGRYVQSGRISPNSHA